MKIPAFVKACVREAVSRYNLPKVAGFDILKMAVELRDLDYIAKCITSADDLSDLEICKIRLEQLLSAVNYVMKSMKKKQKDSTCCTILNTNDIDRIMK